MNNAEFLHSSLQIVIIGHRDDVDTRDLMQVAWTCPDPNRWLQVLAPGKKLPAGHPAAGKDRVEGRPTAYVCRGPVCSLPVTDKDSLAVALAPS